MTENQSTMYDAIKDLSVAVLENYGNHSYEAGYLGMLAVQMLADLPKEKQQKWIDMIVQTRREHEAEALAKLAKNMNFRRVRVLG